MFPGNYEDYLWRKQGGNIKQNEAIRRQLEEVSPAPQVPSNGNPSSGDKSSGNHSSAAAAASAKAKRLNPIKRKKMEDRIRELESEISRAESVIAQCERAMQDFISAEESQLQSGELERHKAAHAAFLKEWEDLSASLQDAG